MTVSRKSVRASLTGKRNEGLVLAALNAAIAVACTVVVTVTGRWPWLLFLAGLQCPAMLLNITHALKAQSALIVYKRNPAAAYIAEVKHAFGPVQSLSQSMPEVFGKVPHKT